MLRVAAMSETPAEADEAVAEPRCRCGYGRDHHMVSREEDHTWFSALVIAIGISQKPIRVRWVCRRCGDGIGEPLELR